MYVLIPALISSIESEHLLRLTLSHIPASANATAVVISQGRRPDLEKPDNLKDLIWRHHQTPLTKWHAIARAREEIPNNQAQVLLLDADDPIEPTSFLKAISDSAFYPATCWIGRRSEILLYAADELSRDSRFFLEMFWNTLLLNIDKPSQSVLVDPPDIQSGFYVLPASILKRVTFDYVRDYGGELALCHQLFQAGASVANLDYTPQPRKASSYRVQQIVKQVMDLPFFQGVTEREIDEARNLAPVLYRRFFNQRQLKSYDAEISQLHTRSKSNEN